VLTPELESNAENENGYNQSWAAHLFVSRAVGYPSITTTGTSQRRLWHPKKDLDMAVHMHREMDRLRERLLRLCGEVEGQLHKAIEAVLKRDPQLADEVESSDRKIDAAEVDIEEECLTILTLHQPVAADLRFLVSVLKINNDLERIGDLAVNIARKARTLSQYPPIRLPFDLSEMWGKAQVMPANGKLLKGYHGIVANPNCSTIQMVLALYRVHDRYHLHEIFVSTYQAVSGAGHKAVVEYERQLAGDTTHAVFPRQIAHNVIPLIGDLKDDISQEEWKMINETRKILNSRSIAVFPTTVRIPVRVGHSESVVARTLFPIMSKEDLVETIASGEDVVVHDYIITPIEVAGDDYVHVSRIRLFDAHTFGLWVVADNLRVGAATNAVRILKLHSQLNSDLIVESEATEVEGR